MPGRVLSSGDSEAVNCIDQKSFKASKAEFIQWLRDVINPQADYGNNICVGDYSEDGNYEYLYPLRFTVNGHEYRWSTNTAHTRGRHLCNHNELWFHGPAFINNCERIATGPLTMTKLRKGFRKIHKYYY